MQQHFRPASPGQAASPMGTVTNSHRRRLPWEPGHAPQQGSACPEAESGPRASGGNGAGILVHGDE